MHTYTDPPLSPGSRVIVRRDPLSGPGPWPTEPTGRVEHLGDAGFEEIETRLGRDRMYLIRFDEPQYDPDGDGPYESSQVLGKYLEEIAARA